MPDGVIAATERHQVTIYLAGIAAAGVLGWAAPDAGPGLARSRTERGAWLASVARTAGNLTGGPRHGVLYL